MLKKKILCIAAALSVCAVTALGAAGCSNSSSKKSTKKKSTASNVETFDSMLDETPETDSKVDVYLADDGTPYYIGPDGKKMMIIAIEFADEEDDIDLDPSSSEASDEEHIVRGEYNSDGLKFTVPDGWFADSTFGSPTLFRDYGEDEELDYNTNISIVPTEYVFTPDTDDEGEKSEITEDIVKDYFDELKDSGFYSDIQFLGSGDIKAAGTDAKYYDIFSEIDEEDEGKIAYRTRYIITPGDNSHCIIVTSLDNDEQFNAVIETFSSFADTIQLPTAEQMQQLEEEAEQEALLESEEEDETDEDE